jgi:hypothetical protein
MRHSPGISGPHLLYCKARLGCSVVAARRQPPLLVLLVLLVLVAVVLLPVLEEELRASVLRAGEALVLLLVAWDWRARGPELVGVLLALELVVLLVVVGEESPG